MNNMKDIIKEKLESDKEHNYNAILSKINKDNVKSSMKKIEEAHWKSNTGKNPIIDLAKYLKNDAKKLRRRRRRIKLA